MRNCWILVALCACAAEPAPHAGKRPEVVVEVDVPPSPDAAAHVAAGQAQWLAGHLDAAIAELDKAGGDPQARALLARVYTIAGRSDDARHTTARAVGSATLEPHVAGDVSKIDHIDVSPDGAYLATMERAERYGVLPTITIWSSLSGRALYAVAGDRVAFGRGTNGDMLVVIVAMNDGQARALDAATGDERWSHGLDRTWDVAADTHNTLTTLAAPDSRVVQFDLSTGVKLRELKNDSNGSVMSLSTDGTTVLGAETLLDLTQDATKLAVLPSATSASGIEDMRVSPDGQRIAVSNKDQSVLVYNRGGAVEARIANAGSQLEFLDDNTIVATDGKHITRWDVAGTQLADIKLPAELAPIERDQLVLGRGGHVVMRRGPELVMLQITTDHPTVIARFGFATRAESIAWSSDGAKLAITTTGDDVLTWSVAGGLVTAPKPKTKPVVATRVQIDANRVFVRDAEDRLVHYYEALATITAAAADDQTVVAADRSGTLDIWNLDTGDGLGSIPGTVPVTALALRADGRTLAVARKGGGIELWDLPSRSHVLTLVAATDTWLVVTPSGRIDHRLEPSARANDGERRGLDWSLGDTTFPGESFGAPEHGLAATVLAHPPPAIVIAPTTPGELAVRPCIPDDVPVRPLAARLAGNVFTFCFGSERSDPYCYGLDVTNRAVAPVPAPIDVIAPPLADSELPGGAQIRETDDGVEVCVTPDDCRSITTKVEIERVAVSRDGAVAAIAIPGNRVETWNTITGKRIARFKVRYGQRASEEGKSLAFWDHDVLAISTPCAGPCGSGNVFSPHGKSLGPVVFEPSGISSSRFHDDLWLLSSEEGFAIADSATGEVISEHDAITFQLAMDSDHVAAVIERGRMRKAVVYGRLGKLVAEAKPPRCKS